MNHCLVTIDGVEVLSVHDKNGEEAMLAALRMIISVYTHLCKPGFFKDITTR